MKLTSALTALALYAASAAAKLATFAPSGAPDIKYSWGVPSGNSGDLYFQINAPSKYQWVGVGIGSSMIGAEIFVIYEDGKGNVTLSNRFATQHAEPPHVDRPDATLISGSGVENGRLIANIKCAGNACSRLDLTSSNGWICAWKTGAPLDSTDPAAQIEQHDSMTTFKVDFANNNAAIQSDTNPFVGAAANGGSTGSSGSTSGGDNGSTEESKSNTDTLVLAHGIIMTIVFVGGFPVGSMLMPMLGKWLIHAGFQWLMLFLMWAGFGIGYTVAKRDSIFFDQAHTRLGVILLPLITLQPVLGALHHSYYKKLQRRTIISYVHIWYGRALMILGMVNGGLGLQLADAPRSFIISYSVLAAVIFALYVSFAARGEIRRAKSSKVARPKGGEVTPPHDA